MIDGRAVAPLLPVAPRGATPPTVELAVPASLRGATLPTVALPSDVAELDVADPWVLKIELKVPDSGVNVVDWEELGYSVTS